MKRALLVLLRAAAASLAGVEVIETQRMESLKLECERSRHGLEC